MKGIVDTPNTKNKKVMSTIFWVDRVDRDATLVTIILKKEEDKIAQFEADLFYLSDTAHEIAAVTGNCPARSHV